MKNIIFSVGDSSCVGGGKNHLYQNRSLAPTGHNLCSSDRTRRTDRAEFKYIHVGVWKCSLAPLVAKKEIVFGENKKFQNILDFQKSKIDSTHYFLRENILSIKIIDDFHYSSLEHQIVPNGTYKSKQST